MPNESPLENTTG